jgi:hypothetical protein
MKIRSPFALALSAALSVTASAAPTSDSQRIAPHFPWPIYDWRFHQPTQAEIERREKMLGVTTAEQQRAGRAEDRELQQLYDRLMSDGGSCAAPEICTNR